MYLTGRQLVFLRDELIALHEVGKTGWYSALEIHIIEEIIEKLGKEVKRRPVGMQKRTRPILAALRRKT